MNSEIWGSNHTSPTQTNSSLTSNLQYKSVLDQIDPDVAKFLSSTNISNNTNNTTLSDDIQLHRNPLVDERRLSFNDGSDILENNQNFFGGFKRGALSAITAPVGGNNYSNQSKNNITFQNFQNENNNDNKIVFGTASISGGIANRHPLPQESFLQKFSNIGDKTREVNSQNSRRTSFNDHSMSNSNSIGFYNNNGSNKSLNETLNMPTPRSSNSRHQSISEKIDNYNNNSPIQQTAKLSLNSDSNESLNNKNNHSNSQPHQHSQNSHPPSFWNPATATSFQPQQNYFMENGLPLPPPQQQQQQFAQNFYRNGQTPNFQPISPPPIPPFMIPSPPPPPQFLDPGLYNMIYGQFVEPQQQNEQDVKEEPNTDVKQDAKDKKEKQNESHQPHGPIGVGLMNRQFSPASFMFHHFNPYTMYQQSPPLGVPPDPALRGLSPPPIPGMNMVPPILPMAVSPPPVQPPPSSSQPPQSSLKSNNSINTTKDTKKNRSNNSSKNNSKNGGSHIYRSPLLEEVRSNPKNKEFFLKDIYGHAIEFTKDQHGSRFIQQKLPTATEEEKEMIFNEIRDISYELMTDVFGNYVIQKYFEHGSKVQQNVLLENMLGHIYELSLQMYGCRVVQRALEAIETEGQIKIIKELQNHILICSKDQNGNHVIQKSIEKIKPFDEIRFVLTSLQNQVYHLSTHPYGCRVIQRLLEFSNRQDQKSILDELNKFIFYLIQDQYGNYVMQHILEHGTNDEKNQIIQIVIDNVVAFSKHKFASNVIEKCIKYGSKQQRIGILNEVMFDNLGVNVETVSDESPLALMMKDQYANYVIQKLVEAFDSKSQEKKILVLKLRQYLKQLSNKNNYGGKHLASVEKMIMVAETALDE